jgi:anti-sigma B factor antagonist
MFRVTIGHVTGHTVGLFVEGTLVIGEAAQHLREMLSSLVTTHAEVIVDFSRLKRIDSTGVGVLVECYSAAQARGSRLRIRNVTGRVRDVLLLVKLLTLLDDDAALAA